MNRIKRLFDFIFSLIGIVVFSPLLFVSYIAVKLEDGQTSIFKQERVGRNGTPFIIYKFRTMRINAEKKGPELFKGINDDARLTKVGRFLRAHHLDELPQLWNVLKGDMSIVGPRPERQFYINQILEHNPRYAELFQMRPGLTSYATLYNGYTDTIEKMLNRLDMDLDYLENQSMWLDIKIIFATVKVMIAGDNSGKKN